MRKQQESRKKKEISPKGRPLVCIPIVEQSREEILASARMIGEKGADMVEWRLDWYEKAVLDWHEAEGILRELSEICGDMILVCTFRSKKQGGQMELTEEEYIRLLYQIGKSGYGDVLDVETAELSAPEEVIRELHRFSVRVLASQHYFFHTPGTEEMERELYAMKELGADGAKLAVMPRKNTDVLHLMEATMHVKERYPSYPLITMAMGKEGILSRIGGQISGSCVTFGTLGKTSAPGQIPLKDLTAILDKIAENLE